MTTLGRTWGRADLLCRGALWLLLLALPMFAQAASCDGGAYPRTEIHPPALVEFSARGVGMLEGLSPWVATNGGGRTAEFNCSADVPISYRVAGHGGNVPGRYHEGGNQYSIYPTGVPGVGMVFGVVYFRSLGSRPTPVDDEDEAYSGPSGTGDIGAVFYVKYIRIGDISNGSAGSNEVMAIEARLFESGSASPLRKQVHIMPTTLKIHDPPTCSVRPLTVNMGIIAVGAFKGIGTNAGQRSYEVELDCEANVGQVNFQVSPTTRPLAIEQGLAEASGGVRGVGYQFLASGGLPLKFYEIHEFGHGSDSGMTLRKTFGVRYQQTEETISPGPANAGLTYTLIFP